MKLLKRSFCLVVLIAALFICPDSARAQDRENYLSRMTLLLISDPANAELDSQQRTDWLLSRGRTTENLELAEAAWVNANAKFRLGRANDARVILELSSRAAPNGANGDRIRAYIKLLAGVMARNDGDFGRALQMYRQAQQGFIASGDDRGQALALQSLGSLYADVGDGESAIRYLALSQETYEGDDPFLLILHNNMGVAYQTGFDHSNAIVQFQKALAIADRLGMDAYATRIRLNIVLSALHSGQLGLARSVLAEIGPAENYANAMQQADIRGFQAFLALKEGRNVRATELIAHALRGVDSQTSAAAYRKLHLFAYTIYAAQGDRARALEHLEAVRRLDAADAAITASNRAAVIAAQFQFAAQNARIARLKAQQQQRDAEYQRNVAIVSVVGSLIALALLLALLVSVTRSRNRARRDGAELAVANQHLSRALAAKAEFLASTSHELRTPLNGILGMTQIMLTNPNLPESMRSQVDLVHDAGSTMRALVDDLLDVAKIEHGGFVISPRPTDIQGLAARVIHLFEGQSQARGVALKLAAEGMPAVRMLVDPDRMTQILFNLVGNALKFTSEGSVTVELAKQDDDRGGSKLLLSVVDEGIGIAPEWHEAIFEMFRQVDGTRTRQFGGTGLGLAICRQLARAMGGDIVLESEVGVGSRFTVTLPWCEVEDELEPLLQGSCSPQVTIRDRDVAVFAGEPLRAALLTAMVRHAGRDAVVIDHCGQIAILAGEAGRICLIDARAVQRLSDAIGPDTPIAASFVIAGVGQGDVPDRIAKAATRVEFARNAVAAAVSALATRQGGEIVDNSSLHQGVAHANGYSGAKQTMQRARAMSGT